MEVLGRIWDLSDVDKDGFLDRDEFAVVGCFCAPSLSVSVSLSPSGPPVPLHED